MEAKTTNQINQTIEITGMSHDCQGIGRLNGQVVFVPNALPEEQVEITLGEKIKKIQHANISKILKENDQRITPICPQYDGCGGCALQIASSSLAAQIKETIVSDALERIAGITMPIEPIVEMAAPYRYRNKGVFHIDESKGFAQMGFYGKKSHRLVPVSDCVLFSQQINKLAKKIEESITNCGKADHIQKVMLRESRQTGDIMVVLITQDASFRLPRLIDTLKKEPKVKSIWHNVNTNPKLMVGHVFHHLHGDKTIIDGIGTQTYQISPKSFFQVNNEQMKHLLDKVIQLADFQGDELVLDLYCGIGSIGLYISPYVQKVVGVESIKDAVLDARDNAQRLSIKNAEFVHAKAEVWLAKWLAEDNKPQIIIVDPPRKGLDESLLEALNQSKVEKIIYISCNPATLARDLKILKENYNCTHIQPVDMFPWTTHVETIALIQRVK